MITFKGYSLFIAYLLFQTKHTERKCNMSEPPMKKRRTILDYFKHKGYVLIYICCLNIMNLVL